MTAPADPRLSDQPPFVWFVRVYDRAGLPALAWLFIGGAVLAVLLRLVSFAEPGGRGLDVSAALHLLTTLATVALPAALLARVPDAPRRLPLLFTGLALLALVVVVRAVIQTLRLGAAATWLAVDVVFLIELAGLLLVGIGLLRLRTSGSAWQPLLILLTAAYFIGALAPGLLVGAVVIDAGLIAPLVATLALAFAHTVALGAWLDGEQPRRFWGLLSLAVAVHLVLLVMSALAVLLVDPIESDIFGVTNPLANLLAALAALAALIAYGRYTPRQPHAVRD